MLGIIAAAGMALRGLPEILMTAEETVNMVSRQQVEFPELTVTVEEVAGDFYYQQLSEKEQTVYRERAIWKNVSVCTRDRKMIRQRCTNIFCMTGRSCSGVTGVHG